MQNIGIVIWRFSPLHIWHISLINNSLKLNKKTIVIVWSANKIDKKNPYEISKRKKILEAEFWKKILLYSLNDYESDLEWLNKLENILDKDCEINDKIFFFWWDLENDYAIQVIKKLSNFLKYKNIEFYEKNRLEIPISWTDIRKMIQEKNYSETKKWLSKKTTKYIL